MAFRLKVGLRFFVALVFLLSALVSFKFYDWLRAIEAQSAMEHAYFLERRPPRNVESSLRWKIESLQERLNSAEKTTESDAEVGRVRDEALRLEIQSLKSTLDRIQSERTWHEVIVANLDKVLAIFFSCLGLYYTREGIRLQRAAQALNERKNAENTTV